MRRTDVDLDTWEKTRMSYDGNVVRISQGALKMADNFQKQGAGNRGVALVTVTWQHTWQSNRREEAFLLAPNVRDSVCHNGEGTAAGL